MYLLLPNKNPLTCVIKSERIYTSSAKREEQLRRGKHCTYGVDVDVEGRQLLQLQVGGRLDSGAGCRESSRLAACQVKSRQIDYYDVADSDSGVYRGITVTEIADLS